MTQVNLPFRSRTHVFVLIIGVVVGMLVAGLAIPLTFGDRIAPGGSGDQSLDAASGGGLQSGGGTAGGAGGEGATADGAATGELGPGGVPLTGAAAPAPGTPGAEGGPPPPPGGTGGGGPAAGGPPRTASDVGVTPDGVRLGVFLLDVGSLARIGISVPGVDPEQQKEAWNVFFDEVNRNGGINGRKIEPVYRSYDVFNQDDQLAACRFMADNKVFGTVDIGGIFGGAVLCITEEQKLPFLTLASQGIPRDFFARSEGRLFSLFPAGVRGMGNMVAEADGMRLLRGKKIGVVGDEETDPGGHTVDTGVVEVLADMGYSVTHRTTLSRDRSTAASQMPIEVSQMQSKGVEVVMLLTSNLYATQFVQAADGRGFRPQYLAADWGSAYSDTWAQNMPASFEGSLVFTASRNGEFRVNKPEPTLDRQCRERYEAATGKKLDRSGLPYNTVLRICSLSALFVASSTRAGVELTRPGWSGAMQGLGPVGLATFGGGSFATGKFDAADLVRTLRWQAACRCWMPIDEFRPGRY